MLLTFYYLSDNYHSSSSLFSTSFYWLPYTLVILYSVSLIYPISYMSPRFGTFLPSNHRQHWILYLKKWRNTKRSKNRGKNGYSLRSLFRRQAVDFGNIWRICLAEYISVSAFRYETPFGNSALSSKS